MPLRSVQIVSVHDGDTVTDNRGLKYRLYGIDAPELKQPWGEESRRELAQILADHYNTLYVQDHGREKYGRTLATFYTTEKPENYWENVNFTLIRRGAAWSYRFRKEEERRRAPLVPSLDNYDIAEDSARKKKKGLWSNPKAQRPSEFRQAQRRKRARRKPQ